MKLKNFCALVFMVCCGVAGLIDPATAKSIKPFNAVHVVIDQELISPEQAHNLTAHLQKTFLVSVDVKRGDDGANRVVGDENNSKNTSSDPTIFINRAAKNNPAEAITEIAVETDIAHKITRIAISDYDDAESKDNGTKLPLSHFYKLVLQQVGLFAGRTDGGCVMKPVKSLQELDELEHSYCALDQKMLHEMGIFKFDEATK